MNQTRSARTARKAVVLAVAAACATPALAIEFETDGGWRGSLNTTLTGSASWRVEKRDGELVGARDAISSGLYSDTTGIAAGCTPGAGLASASACSTANYNAYWLRATQAGYRGGAQTDLNNVNYDKGDRYSTLAKALVELSLAKDGFGGMLRAKAWYDEAMTNGDVRFGTPANGFKADSPLDDGYAGRFNRYSGLELLDAYVYGSFDVADQQLQLRLGRQAVNWGESLFIQGVNQLSPLDVTALRRAGTEVKEALLPVWSAYGNLSLGGGMSLEGYYQLKWENSNVDDCGTYWAGANSSLTNHAGRCDFGFPFYRDNASAYNYGRLVPGAPNQQPIGLNLVNGPKPKDGGQWGVALRTPVDALDTEFGFYAMNIHSRLPVLRIHQGGNLRGTLQAPLTNALKPVVTAGVTAAVKQQVTAKVVGAVPAGTPQAVIDNLVAQQMASAQVQGLIAQTITTTLTNQVKSTLAQLPVTGFSGVGNFLHSTGALAPLAPLAEQVAKVTGTWEYPEDMKVFGISAATTVAGWSVGAEVSYTKDIPIQRNGNDTIVAAVLGVGPGAAEYLAAIGAGTAQGLDIKAYERTHKTQLQFNAVNTLPGMLGAISGLFVGEVGVQWSGVKNSDGDNLRYGRAFIFGNGQHDSYTALGQAVGLPFPAYGCVDPAAMSAAQIASFFTNPNASGCKNDGYMSDFAWGYRLRASLDYPNAFDSGWQLTPTLFWLHDVKGQAVDYQFNEGRKVVSLGLTASLNKVHTVQVTYQTAANSAKFDNNRDKDNLSVVYSYTF